MKNILLYLWQLPQNLLGLIVILFTRAWTYRDIWWTDCNFGVSLGKYIILNKRYDFRTVKHEEGHQKQSLYLGWLYLIIIGIPSASGNIWDRVAHKHWSYQKREQWYYSLPWEAWADRLGGVER
ncbi:MAG: hypothetical protein IKB72_05570 [Ruminococcus sp.]|nr:hypothetical protein [Ruminococcus sp.]